MVEPKKETLKIIVDELRTFDFTDFNPVKDKPKLLNIIQGINAKLGKLLRELEKWIHMKCLQSNWKSGLN